MKKQAFDKIVQGAKEAIAIERGEAAPARRAPRSRRVGDITGESPAGIANGSDWRHIKTGNIYRVLLLAKSEQTRMDQVVYRRLPFVEYDPAWVRPLSQFIEKFEAVNP